MDRRPPVLVPILHRGNPLQYDMNLSVQQLTQQPHKDKEPTVDLHSPTMVTVVVVVLLEGGESLNK